MSHETTATPEKLQGRGAQNNRNSSGSMPRNAS